MTNVYFVRHAQPVHAWEDDRTRPLSAEGISDSKKVTAFFSTIPIDSFFSSPYKRSLDTILESAGLFDLRIHTDERFRERQKGSGGITHGMFEELWADFNFCEQGGESLGMAQKRNIEALFDVLNGHNGENIVIGTHGTALSTILNYYNPTYGCSDFLRIINYMPYIIRLTFEGEKYIGQEELLIVKKEFIGANRANKSKIPINSD